MIRCSGEIRSEELGVNVWCQWRQCTTCKPAHACFRGRGLCAHHTHLPYPGPVAEIALTVADSRLSSAASCLGARCDSRACTVQPPGGTCSQYHPPHGASMSPCW